jgi:uncharacterized membrane protein YdcZ (DUF606 family)
MLWAWCQGEFCGHLVVMTSICVWQAYFDTTTIASLYQASPGSPLSS